MADIIELHPTPEPRIGYTIELYYAADGIAKVRVHGMVEDQNALAEDLEKAARALRAQASPDDDLVVGTVQIYRSSKVVAYMAPSLTGPESRAWLERRVDDAKRLFNPKGD